MLLYRWSGGISIKQGGEKDGYKMSGASSFPKVFMVNVRGSWLCEREKNRVKVLNGRGRRRWRPKPLAL